MSLSQDEMMQLFRDSGALLEGHFILRSGLRSGHFFQCARLGEDLGKITLLAEALREKCRDFSYTTVLAPAMGGLVIGQEVARQSGSRFLFAEKKEDQLVLRRGFKFTPGEKVLVVEDVITRGGRALEAIEIVRAAGGDPVALAVIADRSAGQAHFPIPQVSLVELNFPTHPADQIPPELASIPPVKPGS